MERRLHTISPTRILLLICLKLKNCLEVLTVVLCHEMGRGVSQGGTRSFEARGVSAQNELRFHISQGFTCPPCLWELIKVVFTV